MLSTRFRLVAIDLDGTLLTTWGAVSDQTVWRLRRVQAGGAQMVPAIARLPQSIEPLRASLGLVGAVLRAG